MKELLEKFKREPIFSKFTDCQKKFIEAVFARENICLTGPAGSGKSFCLTALFRFFEENNISTSKTALTGVAALNIGGSTLHSWAGIGLAKEEADELLKIVRYNKKATTRIKKANILFVDEISMASAGLIDKLDVIFKLIRRNQNSFGGIQMIFVGDFLQLPPVFNSRVNEKDAGFAFRSKAWKRAMIKTICLKEIKRQDSNSAFAKMLNGIRVGDASHISVLKDRINFEFPKDGIKPVKIFCKNIDVAHINQRELDAISGIEHTFYAFDTGSEHQINFLNKNCKAPNELKLKVGAQVMLLTNVDVDMGLVNGSIGVVEGFVGSGVGSGGVEVLFANNVRSTITKHKWEIKEDELGLDGRIRSKVIAKREQIPLCLAWATTVHKCQGSTLDRAEVDVSEAFTAGQVYVALSRVRNLESISVKPFAINKIFVNEECLDFYNEIDKIEL